MNNKIYFVVPCYNEEDVLHETASRLGKKLTSLIESEAVAPNSRIFFVDDGSKDNTWELIRKLGSENKKFGGIRLSRNRGHQNALLAGLMAVKDDCDACITMDADLQDDINVLDEFISQYKDGCDVVYGVRKNRRSDTAFKRGTAVMFYKIMRGLGVDIVQNHAEYRLMSKRVLDSLAEFSEVNLFLRGMIPLIGFKSGTVEYDRHQRFAGKTKYPLKKMITFAFDGITSFSARPIRMIFWLGVIVFLVSIAIIIRTLAVWALGYTVAGWTTILASIWALGGIQLLSLGIVGEYIGKIYREVKRRPPYIIQEII
ncbi:MAG: glycosyltransferase family 2 protein [Oscillospiraceae bacterium]|nr:glycosyltransferase family 2 protein [Oscillospiraceae bacterium]